MASPKTSFIVKVDPSVKLSTRARNELASAIGGSTSALLARLDLKGTVAFVPRIEWPGGMIIDLAKVVSPAKLRELGIEG